MTSRDIDIGTVTLKAGSMEKRKDLIAPCPLFDKLNREFFKGENTIC